MLPPRWLRRTLVAPIVPVATLLLITTLPLWLIGAAAASPWLPGRLRPLRLLWFLLVFAAIESLALLVLLALWVVSGLGWRIDAPSIERAHWATMHAYLHGVVRSGHRVFNLRFATDVSEAEEVPLDPDPSGETPAVRHRPPLIVLSRHAGPGDSMLLVHALVQLGYRPRIVLRDRLQWAPALDVILNRLPNLFLASGDAPGRRRAAIARLAAGLREGDALVLFPEGRNFTPTRRLASIARLEEKGEHAAAEQAREMRHVLVPRSGGAAAALAAAPRADVIFVAHTGLEDLSSPVDLWRGTPMDSSIRVKLWRVAAPDAPRTEDDETARWLLGWWRRIDGWILENQGRGGVPDAVVDAVTGGERLEGVQPLPVEEPFEQEDAPVERADRDEVHEEH
jgi:1-acyl-sn-glycerol-3-phosphate acyltransferase